MTEGQKKKYDVLGIDPSTAQNRLKKILLFKYIKLAKENICFQCNKEIISKDELSIEHKIPWIKNGKELFWDINNIAFSHLKCNIGAAEKSQKGKIKHPSISAYKKGCRCNECRDIQRILAKEYRAKKKLSKII